MVYGSIHKKNLTPVFREVPMPKVPDTPHPNRMPPGVSHPVDIFVGARVRRQRKIAGLSQTELGDALGLTFQQIQKYERGANRIGASRLYQISKILGISISYFFDDMPEEIADGSVHLEEARNLADDPRDEPEVIASEETTELVTSYYAISDPRKRKAVHDLIADLSKSPWDA